MKDVFFNKKSSGFSVSGTKILDSKGNNFIIRGVSHSHTWFKNDINLAIPSISKITNSNTVRIVLSNGSIYEKDSNSSVSNIISLCLENKLIPILEVHDATGSDSLSTLEEASNYWISLMDVLNGFEDKVIINIANEWYSKNNSYEWSSGYIKIIPKLRNAGLKHLFIVDCAGWGQYPNTITEKGLDIFNSDVLKNTIFSIHMYENAGKNAESIMNNINNALSINIPVIVGEFGHSHDGVIIDSNTILNYCNENLIGWLAWSWYGNNSEASYLDLSTGPNGNLTDWGNFIVNSDNGIKNTSIICKIFDI